MPDEKKSNVNQLPKDGAAELKAVVTLTLMGRKGAAGAVTLKRKKG